jgi:phosphoserine aminotransferase
MSSDILSRPVDIAKYSLIYAGAQKNMGPAGVAVAIVKDAMLAQLPEKMHPMLDYRIHAENASLYNTPPCWSIYICGLVYKHMLENGGVPAAQKMCEKRSGLLYAAIDGSGGFFKGHAQTDCRSTMNVTFTLPNDDLTAKFLKEAQALKLDGLKGHRSVGGCRASIYNAFPLEGCEVLANFMKEFAAQNA